MLTCGVCGGSTNAPHIERDTISGGVESGIITLMGNGDVYRIAAIVEKMAPSEKCYTQVPVCRDCLLLLISPP
jgi:hypothetical protein